MVGDGIVAGTFHAIRQHVAAAASARVRNAERMPDVDKSLIIELYLHKPGSDFRARTMFRDDPSFDGRSPRSSRVFLARLFGIIPVVRSYVGWGRRELILADVHECICQ